MEVASTVKGGVSFAILLFSFPFGYQLGRDAFASEGVLLGR